MTPEPDNKRRSRFKSPLYLIGFILRGGGATFAGFALAKQITNTVEGRHFYDWIAIGTAIFLLGFAMMIVWRRTTHNAGKS